MSAKYGWYAVLVALAQDDPLKIDEVTEMKLEGALLYLSYMQDKRILERNNYNA